MLRSVGGTVFQTAVLSMVINPETASRVTLAYARYCLPDSTPPFIKSVDSDKSVFVLPPSFFRTLIYRIDADASLVERVSPLDKIR